jgi:hypothetical protein
VSHPSQAGTAIITDETDGTECPAGTVCGLGTVGTVGTQQHLSEAEAFLLEALHAGVEVRPIGGEITVTGEVSSELKVRLDNLWPEIGALFVAVPAVPLPGRPLLA